MITGDQSKDMCLQNNFDSIILHLFTTATNWQDCPNSGKLEMVCLSDLAQQSARCRN